MKYRCNRYNKRSSHCRGCMGIVSNRYNKSPCPIAVLDFQHDRPSRRKIICNKRNVIIMYTVPIWKKCTWCGHILTKREIEKRTFRQILCPSCEAHAQLRNMRRYPNKGHVN